MRSEKPMYRGVAAYAGVLVAALFCAAVLAVAGCGRQAETLPPPAAAVQRLLEMRSDLTTDPVAYLGVVESTALAQVLADDAASRPPTSTPTPRWSTPEVTEQSTSTAQVRVEWRADKRFEGWPPATLFFVQQQDGKWLVLDAVDSTATAK